MLNNPHFLKQVICYRDWKRKISLLRQFVAKFSIYQKIQIFYS